MSILAVQRIAAELRREKKRKKKKVEELKKKHGKGISFRRSR